MSATPSVQVYSRVVYAPDAKVDLSVAVDPSAADSITKLVIGELGDTQFTLPVPLASDLRDLFPNLTHLHLWNLENLEAVPVLPKGLRGLDVRGCPRLAELPKLPGDVESLVLEACPALRMPAHRQRLDFPRLADLSIRGSEAIDEEWLHAVLPGAANLRILDASNCGQITGIPRWAPRLEDVRLDGCTRLAGALPAWPTSLRRIGLRGAKAIEQVPDFHDGLDYIDLAHAESLRALPQRRGNPATLFLHGSGLREPPTSEQGATDSENVALTTRQFFEDVELTGRGEVKRCKLLILGNGSAGKTCLALALTGQDPEDAARVHGSTHGVQFWDWPDFKAPIDKRPSPINLHVWDFGGQEIYHNTHRLFMGTGTVFVVVWNSEQDGKQPPEPEGHEDGEYQDEWRPLRYWVDLIHQACPNKPLIAIVCSHHRSSTPELKERLRVQLGDGYEAKYKCFFVDSLEQKRAPSKAGQIARLEDWIRTSVGQVVEAQGTTVPSYWEIAQEMVEGWVKRLQARWSYCQKYDGSSNHRLDELLRQRTGRLIGFLARRGGAANAVAIAAALRKSWARRVALHREYAKPRNRVTMAAFQAALQQSITAAIKGGSAGKYRRLAESTQDGRFTLHEHSGASKRLERTLRFLTHSGWVYWDERLYGREVIIGQAWALKGIYAALERRRNRTVYRSLNRDRGRFTRSSLGQLSWNSDYSPDEQKLLLSFMERCGLCFKLRDAEHAWLGEDVYVSFEHLPTADEAGLTKRFRERFPDAPDAGTSVRCDTMHKRHWQALLVAAGQEHGTRALYAADGLYLENEDGEKLLVRCRWHPGKAPEERPGFGGIVEIHVGGGKATERLAAEEAWVRRFLPSEGGAAKPDEAAAWRDGTGRTEGAELEEVFISYTWDYPPEKGGPGVPRDYEAPAVAIERWLLGQGWVPLRDKSRIESGDDIKRFMEYGAARPRIIIVHSDKYWRSPCCMFECKELLAAMIDREDRVFREVVVAIEHHDSRITDQMRMAEYAEAWAAYKGYCPAGIWESPQQMRAKAPGIVWDMGERLSKLANLNIHWDAGEKAVFAKLASLFKREKAERGQGKKGR